ncbi:MAG: ABC transporter substrate-binding protein [Verrucomicrobia bacterium]|nr:ABC transporter substrate-binding protein [Verrucomicrobiota bacterium]
MQSPPSPLPSRRPKLVTALIETFGFSPWLASLISLFLLLLAGAALLWVFLSAPPRTITITSGPPGSSFERHAKAYEKELAKRGVTLKIVPSGGSLENLQRLLDPKSGVDLGFVQGGLVGDETPPDLVSLGSIAYQPLWLFYRGTARIARISELTGKRIGIGAPGSGVHSLALALLEPNGVTTDKATLVQQPGESAGKDFQAGKLDALFLMGDSAPTQTLRALIRDPEVQVYSFTQADAYVRRLPYLNKISLPQGSFDFGRNLPPQDIVLLGPTVELIAREGLNSALSDLLLGVAQEVHGKSSGLIAKRGEFPAPLEHEFTLSDDALRYYKSGKGLTYKLVTSFWLASLINRLLVAIVPILLVLIPAIRFLPVAYRWSVQIRIYRCYRPLLQLERDAATTPSAAQTAELLKRLDAIERDVNALKVPASFASQFYDLRNHVTFVRRRLTAATPA